jgi:hypothetical protein
MKKTKRELTATVPKADPGAITGTGIKFKVTATHAGPPRFFEGESLCEPGTRNSLVELLHATLMGMMADTNTQPHRLKIEVMLIDSGSTN